jgi:hypothetical protein
MSCITTDLEKQIVLRASRLMQGNCTSSAGKTEELGQVGNLPPGAFALNFQ